MKQNVIPTEVRGDIFPFSEPGAFIEARYRYYYCPKRIYFHDRDHGSGDREKEDGMISYFSELRYKEVIEIHSGRRLGYVCDAELDEAEGRLISLITPGRAKLFGLLGREDDYVLPWKCIVRMGTDIILVETDADMPRRKRKNKNFFDKPVKNS